MDLPTMRARLRKDLHDEDSANYRWTDGELDRHIQHAVREFSLALPLEARAALTTTPGSRDLSISGLADLVAIEAVEYPADQYPPDYARFSVWLTTLTLLVEAAPAAAETVNVYHTKLHTIDGTSSTLPALRGHDRGRRRRLRRARVGVVLDEPGQRRRPRRLARVPRLGPGAPGRVPADPGPAREAERGACETPVHRGRGGAESEHGSRAVGGERRSPTPRSGTTPRYRYGKQGVRLARSATRGCTRSAKSA